MLLFATSSWAILNLLTSVSQFFLNTDRHNVIEVATSAQPHPWGTCAIGSDAFLASTPCAAVLLVLTRGVQIPLPVLPKLGVGRRRLQHVAPLLHPEWTLMTLSSVIRLQMLILYELPSQHAPKVDESGHLAILPEPEKTDDQKSVHLHESQDESKHTALPPVREPSSRNETL